MSENNESLKQEVNVNNLEPAIKKEAGHQWRQQGPYLICSSCDLQHSSHIGLGHQLVGIDDAGKPILTKR